MRGFALYAWRHSRRRLRMRFRFARDRRVPASVGRAAAFGLDHDHRLSAYRRGNDPLACSRRPRPARRGRLDAAALDAALKSLYATGLFADVKITRQGDGILIAVIENPTVDRLAFEGNKKIKDEDLRKAVQSKLGGPLSRAIAHNDVDQIVELYRRRGCFDVKVDPQTIKHRGRRQRTKLSRHRRYHQSLGDLRRLCRRPDRPLRPRPARFDAGGNASAIDDAVVRLIRVPARFSLANNSPPSVRVQSNNEFAGLGDAAKFARTNEDVRYHHKIFGDVVGVAHAQSGYATPWGGKQLPLLNGFFGGPQLVRGFAPNGFGPRDVTSGNGAGQCRRQYLLDNVRRIASAGAVRLGGCATEGRFVLRRRKPVGDQHVERVPVGVAVALAADRQLTRAPRLGRRQPDLGFAVRRTPGRLCLPGRQAKLRRHPTAELHRRRVLIWRTSIRERRGRQRPLLKRHRAMPGPDVPN